MRVFELAKELKIPTKELILHGKSIDINITGNFFTLSEDQIVKLKKQVAAPAIKPKVLLNKEVVSARKVRKRTISAAKIEKLSLSKQEEKDLPAKKRKDMLPKEDQIILNPPQEELELMNTSELKSNEELPSTLTVEKDPKNHQKNQSEEELLEKNKKHRDEKNKLKKDDEDNNLHQEKNRLKKRLKFYPNDDSQDENDTDDENDINLDKNLDNKNDTVLKTPSPKVKIRYGESYKPKQHKQGKKQSAKNKHIFNPRKKDLKIGNSISVSELAALIGIKVPMIIKGLMSLGIMATINQVLDAETAALIASENGIELKIDTSTIEDTLQIDNQVKNIQSRPPVVVIMGHVDHGKTSLLDRIRQTKITEKEAGGITQHIGAYSVKINDGTITFLDTPGHAAFTNMRARGANVTDVVILVVAADDGPKPQTIEAINHAKAAKVPIIVAINKCDKPNADPMKTTMGLMEHGLISEEMGGDCIMVNISAKTGEGIDHLLEMIHLQAEMMELATDYNKPAEGVVIESKIDKGLGNKATFLVQSGILKNGDYFVVGTEYGRVKMMINDHGQVINQGTPSMPLEVLGLNQLPNSGDRFQVGQNEKQVKEISTQRKQNLNTQETSVNSKSALEAFLNTTKKEERKLLKLIIKADVIGSSEALSDTLSKIGNEEVGIQIIYSGVGAISISDIALAGTGEAIIIGFNVAPENNAKKQSIVDGVNIQLYNVIYDAIDYVKNELEKMLKPLIREEIQGKAKVLQSFIASKVGNVAGAIVEEGKISHKFLARVLRDDNIIHEGPIISLRRFKDLVKEVQAGQECGIGIENYQNILPGDLIEVFIRIEEKNTL